MSCFKTRATASLIAGLGLICYSASGAMITATGAAGWPNGRNFDSNVPANVIDGNINTYTWTTNPNNTAAPSYLGISFDPSSLSSIRLWKDRNGGGGQNIKNLVIQYTTDGTSTALSSRSWTTVSGMINGMDGQDFWDATSVNSNGAITGDIHTSSLEGPFGWAAVTFNAVSGATGVRIAFSNPNPTTACTGLDNTGVCNHYNVSEFQAYYSDAPEPSTLALLGAALALTGLRLRRK